MTQANLTKSVVIRGHAGSGKTFFMLYIDFYIVYQNYCIKLSQQGCAIVNYKLEHNIGIKFYVYVVTKTM